MDMKRIKRHLLSGSAVVQQHTDPENEGRVGEKKSGGGGSNSKMVRSMGILVVACLMLVPIIIILSLVYRYPSSNPLPQVPQARLFEHKEAENGAGNGLSQSADIREDKLLSGLLVAGFDEGSCLSRYQSVLYRKASTHRPSPYLLARLRRYEALHKKCGPDTESYNKTLDGLRSGDSGRNSGITECKYVVWISNSGLGNRILTVASAFLYSLLTDRVLLVDRGADMSDLFCEPFPENSWLLPLDFPLNQFRSFDGKSSESYGNMLKNNIISNDADDVSSGSPPVSVYLHLAHDYDDHDKLFFCEQDQLLLQKIPWLFMRSDNYFVPSLFLIPTFEQELSSLFPEKDTVFYHLGRYIFHPSNSVWGLITRFYQAYLSNAAERIGIQIRSFDTGTGPFQYVLDQILACSLNENLLPNVTFKETDTSSTVNQTPKVVLITSLSSGYFEKIRNMYWEHPTVNGEIVSVYQPSHEEYQQTEKQTHNMKAWAEMYLLSLSDVLVTSSWSTFGYVAQGLGGIKPWILFKPENQTAPDPACRRAMSMEPCFHAPPFYDCKAKRGVDTGELVPHVRHCEDMSWGLKLVSNDEW